MPLLASWRVLAERPLWARAVLFLIASTSILLHRLIYSYWKFLSVWHPWPGLFIAILALLGVLVPLLREHIGRREKAVWTIVMFALLILEVRSLRLASDDFEQDRKSANDRFDTTASGLKTTANGLEKAVSGIDSTLKSANATLLQTRPHGALHFTTVGIVNAPTTSSGFQANTPYNFRSDLMNSGNDDAAVLRMLRKIYIGKPDDKQSQQSLADTFELEWAKTKRDTAPVRNAPAEPGLFETDMRVFTGDEIKQISNGGTIYILRRLEYSDQTGKWVSEDCQHLQVHDGQIYVNVTHPCLIFDRSRARVH